MASKKKVSGRIRSRFRSIPRRGRTVRRIAGHSRLSPLAVAPPFAPVTWKSVLSHRDVLGALFAVGLALAVLLWVASQKLL